MHAIRRHVLILIASLLTLLGLLAGAPQSARADGPAGAPDRGGARASDLGTATVGFATTGEGPSAIAYDLDTDTIYVGTGLNADGPNAGVSRVTMIDARRCDAHSVQGCQGPWPTVTLGQQPAFIAVDAGHHSVYVANSGDATVSIIDSRTCNARITAGCGNPLTVPVGQAPTGMAVDTRHHTLYVTNFADSTISLIDTATCNAATGAGCPATAPPAMALPDQPGSIDINTRTHTAYLPTLTGLAVAFDTNTCNVGDRSGCGSLGVFTICTDCYGPFTAVVDDRSNTLYAGDGDTTIVAIDGRSCQSGTLNTCATAPSGRVSLPQPGFEHVLSLVLDKELHSLYASFHKSGQLFVLDVRRCNRFVLAGCAKQQPQSVHVGANPQGIALDRSTHTLYVADERDASVAVVDAARCSALDSSGCRVKPPSVTVESATAVAVSQRVSTAYVTAGDNRVAMIDIVGCNAYRRSGCRDVQPVVEVGNIPRGVFVDDATHTLYVANRGRNDDPGTVTVIDTLSCNARNSTCSRRATLTLPGGHPDQITMNTATGTLYVTLYALNGSNVVAAFNASTCNASVTTGCSQPAGIMRVTATAGCGTSRMAVAVERRTNTVYATDVSCGAPQVGDRVYVFDGRGCDATHRTTCSEPAATVLAGLNPYGLAVDEITRTVFVPLLGDGELSGSVALIDARACNATSLAGCARPPAATPAGFGSASVAVDPITHQVVVTNVEEGSVSVIDGRHCRASHTGSCARVTVMRAADDYSYGVAIAHSVRTAYVASGTRGTVSMLGLARTA